MSPPFIRPSSSYLYSSRTGFLGPKGKRKYLVLRGFIGSNAMILLYYAVQQMPLADATVIMFRWEWGGVHLNVDDCVEIIVSLQIGLDRSYINLPLVLTPLSHLSLYLS